MVDLDGVIHYAPNVPGFRTLPVRAALAEATGLPTIVDNDANAAAYAELKLGVAAGADATRSWSRSAPASAAESSSTVRVLRGAQRLRRGDRPLPDRSGGSDVRVR